MSSHEMLNAYFDALYAPYATDIQQSLHVYHDQHYGELYYYSLVVLLKYLRITPQDHVLDIGSGLGKIIFQLFLTTDAASVTGIEINAQRYAISQKIHQTLQQQVPEAFSNNRLLTIIHGDFLTHDFSQIHVIYVCSSVFSLRLLAAIGQRINTLPNLRIIASFRKLPHLTHFKLVRKLFLHTDWEKTPCYLYERSD